MNLAIKHVRLFFKSAIPKTMNVIHEGSRFKLQKRDYGGISDNSWKSAVSDSEWLCKNYTIHSSAFRLMHFIPTMDGYAGIPLQNEVNRFPYSKPEGYTSPRGKESYRSLFDNPMETVDSWMKQNFPNLVPQKQIPENYMKQTETRKVIPASVGADEEAFFFSANFLLVALLFVTMVLLRKV